MISGPKLIELKKICTKCKIPKTLDKFHKDKPCRFGVSTVCKKCKSIYRKKYYKINRNKELERSKTYSNINKKQKKCWTINNKKHIKNYNKKYNKTHKERRNLYERTRRKTNPKIRLNCNISGAIRKSLKSGKDGKSWTDLVDYTIDALKQHLEKQFKNGMSWGNQGEWHVDHVIPIAHFNFTSPDDEDFKKCWKLENLQPLWAGENFSKGSKLQ